MFKKNITIDGILRQFATARQQLVDLVATNNGQIIRNLEQVDTLHYQNDVITKENERAQKAQEALDKLLGL